MLLVYIGPLFDPNQAWIFTLLGLGYPYLLIINVLFVILWMIFLNRYICISAITILLGVVQLDRFYGLSGSGLEVEQDDVEVLSFNAQGFYKVDFEGSAFKHLLSSTKESDILLLQECPPSAAKKLQAHLPNHQLYQPKGLSLAIFSKTPISASGIINKENSSNGSVWIDTEINGQPLRIYNSHLLSYRVTQTTSDLIDSPDITDERTWTDVKWIAAKIRDMSKLRSKQVTEISEHINQTNKPIVLGGDFNDTPVSNTYRRLSSDFTDSFCAAGKGVGTTYAGKIPLLRIDYIFADASFEVVDHEVINSSISDHYPIKSVIRLQPD